MTCKHVEIWLNLEFMTVAKSDFYRVSGTNTRVPEEELITINGLFIRAVKGVTTPLAGFHLV